VTLDMEDLDDDNSDDNDDKEDDPDVLDIDDIDNDNIDELDDLDTVSHEALIADMMIIHTMVSKLHQLSFSIIQSTTISLPAWHRYCRQHSFKSHILP